MADCEHTNQGYENDSSPFDPNTPMVRVCYDCNRSL